MHSIVGLSRVHKPGDSIPLVAKELVELGRNLVEKLEESNANTAITNGTDENTSSENGGLCGHASSANGDVLVTPRSADPAAAFIPEMPRSAHLAAAFRQAGVQRRPIGSTNDAVTGEPMSERTYDPITGVEITTDQALAAKLTVQDEPRSPNPIDLPGDRTLAAAEQTSAYFQKQGSSKGIAEGTATIEDEGWICLRPCLTPPPLEVSVYDTASSNRNLVAAAESLWNDGDSETIAKNLSIHTTSESFSEPLPKLSIYHGDVIAYSGHWASLSWKLP
jgi:hypothetical protein